MQNHKDITDWGFFKITLLALVTHLFKNNVYEYKLNFWQRFNSHVTNQESLYGFMRPGLVPCFNTQRTNLHSVQSPVTHQDMECLCSCYDRSTLMEMGWGGVLKTILCWGNKVPGKTQNRSNCKKQLIIVPGYF